MNTEARIEALYAKIPDANCKQLCQATCGMIMKSPIETRRIGRRLGYFPNFLSKDMRCPMLTSFGQCRIYDIRPAVCRMYGVVDGMPCEWGCQPDEHLHDRDASAILRSLQRMG